VTAFVDTSALLAVLHAGDANHTRAARSWREIVRAFHFDGHFAEQGFGAVP
jgi:predicted nucleic acid-binding protein